MQEGVAQNENQEQRQKKFLAVAGGEEPLHEFPAARKQSEMERRESNDLFAEAQANLISEKMFALFTRAITDKIVTGSNDNLAFVHNRIVEECLNLSSHDTELLLNQFNREVREWVVKKFASSPIDARVYKSIALGEYTHGDKNIDIRGITNVISFLQARAALLSSSPAQSFTHYFSSVLDSRYSVDIIEERYDGTNPEPIISLIQIKSSQPSELEMQKIYADHCEWVSRQWMDFDTYENSYIEEEAEAEAADFLNNKEKVKDAILEFYTNPLGQNLDQLVDSLHMTGLNDRQEAWILWKYIDLIKEPLDASELDAGTKDSIWKELNTLKADLERKAKLPKSQFLVRQIKSIIAVGANIVKGSERDIVVPESGKVVNIR